LEWNGDDVAAVLSRLARSRLFALFWRQGWVLSCSTIKSDTASQGMLSDDSLKRVSEFRAWVRSFEHTWSHLHVAALALLLEDKWVAIRFGVVLADRPRGPKPWGLPIASEERILAFRTALPMSDLDRLISAAIEGRIDQKVIPGLDRRLSLALPVDDTPTQASWQPYMGLDHGISQTPPRTVPRAELTIQSKSPADALKEPWKQYAEMEHEERRFIKRAHGSIGVLGMRLGLWTHGVSHIQNFWNLGVTSEFIAPLPARLLGVEHERETDVVRAHLELGHLVRRNDVTLAMRPGEQTAWFPARRVPSGKRRIKVDVVRRPPPGPAVVSLCVEPVGEVSAQSVTVEPPLNAWPLPLALARLDNGHRLLRQGLDGVTAFEFERSISILLVVIGYASVWWGPDIGKKLPRPGDLQPGAAPDTMGYHQAWRDLIVVEATTGVVGSDKITKLIGRALRLRTAVTDVLGSQSPSVRAVLATSLPAGEIGPAASDSLLQNGVGLLAREAIDDLLKLILDGATQKEVRQRFGAIFPNGHLVRGIF
jgi:hypothetical protein